MSHRRGGQARVSVGLLHEFDGDCLDPPSIDWTRMAEPQADGYDTDMTLYLSENVITPLRPRVYQRRAIEGTHAFCHDKVALRPAPERGLLSETIVPAELNHRHLEMGAALLARWPTVYSQFQRLIDTVYPYTDPEQTRLGKWALGSSSHSYEEEPGSVHSTIDDALGFAQALVHEMAHQKLRALGVSLDSAERLIVNDPSQLFKSPLHKDWLRPITAVFHDQYSFIYVTALDLEMFARSEEEWESQRILMLLARNVPRMEVGFDEIGRHIRTDAAGEQFFEAFMQWSRNVLLRGRQTLDANGYGLH